MKKKQKAINQSAENNNLCAFFVEGVLVLSLLKPVCYFEQKQSKESRIDVME